MPFYPTNRPTFVLALRIITSAALSESPVPVVAVGVAMPNVPGEITCPDVWIELAVPNSLLNPLCSAIPIFFANERANGRILPMIINFAGVTLPELRKAEP